MLIRSQGDAGYIGENISQLEHSLQAADQARQAGKLALVDGAARKVPDSKEPTMRRFSPRSFMISDNSCLTIRRKTCCTTGSASGGNLMTR